jgi:hypothetical protein
MSHGGTGISFCYAIDDGLHCLIEGETDRSHGPERKKDKNKEEIDKVL